MMIMMMTTTTTNKMRGNHPYDRRSRFMENKCIRIRRISDNNNTTVSVCVFIQSPTLLNKDSGVLLKKIPTLHALLTGE
jgi:hypothetical protein